MADRREGTILDGRYEILEAIADGGMGRVYRGQRVGLGRPVAIKFLHDWKASDEAARKRFHVETRAAARLDHRNCAAVIDFGSDDDLPYVVMEYAAGDDLRTILDRGPLEPRRAVDILGQVLAGLAHAHELGIIHRDIKPANIIVGERTGDGSGVEVKILDFGLARARGEAQGLTADGIAVGTPSYMAPEQLRGGDADPRTDLYACGVLLFEMLTGDKPFKADRTLDLLRMHLEAPPPTIASMRPEASVGELESVVARALAKDPDERYDGATAMAAALDDALPRRRRGRAGTAVIAAAVRRTQAMWTVIVLGALLVVGLAMAAITGADWDAQPDAGPDPGTIASDGVEEDLFGDGPEAASVVEAKELLAAGDTEGAVKLLVAARRTYPDSADVAYLLGRIYFDRRWWNDGLEAYRAAVTAAPALRAHPPLIKSVLRGFVVTPERHAGLADFLHDEIGAPAVPYLEETARDHPNPSVRERAERELERY